MTQPMMIPAVSPADSLLLLLLVVLLSVVSVLSTDAVTVAFTSPAPTFPARSWYVPASKQYVCIWSLLIGHKSINAYFQVCIVLGSSLSGLGPSHRRQLCSWLSASFLLVCPFCERLPMVEETGLKTSAGHFEEQGMSKHWKRDSEERSAPLLHPMKACRRAIWACTDMQMQPK